MADDQRWRDAFDRFAALLADPDSLESSWQGLFEEHPYILTNCLALGIEPPDLVPCKPGEAAPDFLFYPKEEDPLSPYGVIELKRPSMRLLRKPPRKKVICLSGDATAAFAQAQKYGMDLDAKVSDGSASVLALGNRRHPDSGPFAGDRGGGEIRHREGST